MILNPPHIMLMLRTYGDLTGRLGADRAETIKALALLLRQFHGFLTWDSFLSLYHLYLQSIPMDLAKEAWGLNAAQAASITHQQP